MEPRDLTRRCQDLIRTLDVPEPFDLHEFCDRLQHTRARELRLLPTTAPPGSPHGMWIATATTDYIVHDRGASIRHQQHIILHEIGHMLLQHEGTPQDSEALNGLLFPDLDPRLVKRRLRGIIHASIYNIPEEQEADLFALMLPSSRKSSSTALPSDRTSDLGATGSD